MCVSVLCIMCFCVCMCVYVCVCLCVCVCAQKTKILAVRPVHSCSVPPRAIKLGEEQELVEVVQEFEYLGSTISQDCSLDVEVSRQISKASRVFRSL